jgi:2-oxoglutarate/2-oxoacid ferredoxin oxidoreductase subunit beta
MPSLSDFKKHPSTWCSACGNFGIWTAVKKALVKQDLGPDDVLFVYGIGCHGHMGDFLKTHAFEALHGRAIPVASAAKMVNKNLPIVVSTGDGDCLGEGGNHFIHGIRGNQDITVLIHDNQTYGLTTGQTSPTSMQGYKTKSTPAGVIEVPINPLMLALTAGATFVAQGFSQDLVGLGDIITKAMKHPGFSVVNIFQPCVTFNKVNTYDFFKERTAKIDESHDKTNKHEATKLALMEDKLPIGVLFEEKRRTYEEQLAQLEGDPIVKKKVEVRDMSAEMKVLQ